MARVLSRCVLFLPCCCAGLLRVERRVPQEYIYVCISVRQLGGSSAKPATPVREACLRVLRRSVASQLRARKAYAVRGR